MAVCFYAFQNMFRSSLGMFSHFPICYRIVSSGVSKSIEYTARWCPHVKYDSCKQREIIKLIL